ncbi:phosphate signaling complex protein PhoU [Mycolicibacterium confluentis]|uniref:Phosphate-specific transport system accessory protein PhoU n=1 Tax=Mycolicibacterium confluentis TaxID=28047 RepID=A0A7I7Y3G6_9MYCO|nr:phosphate signaling complex protein PhoU [Mycolicibacterium confluentis]MCV7318266.1 phosphate signaling complex protein PhoU [Mycolicibacterium confluentis]ORV29591.1 PhoU family transcriptional regulator [Mycolicibacterium confluentis]BBZ36178.1 phosphate transport system regulatory protein PhoU [Mycolicibacterium confluentis]
MRSEFHRQLDALNTDLALMCHTAGAAMHSATEGLVAVDVDAAEQALSTLDELSQMRRTVEHNALALLALQAPVASDLRAVVAAVHIASDADRMGGLAAHVARTVRRLHPTPVLPHEVVGQLAEMGNLATDLAEDAAAVIKDGDPVRASRIRDDDEAMDNMNRGLFAIVMSPHWHHGVAAAVDLVLLGRFYERFADHAVAIAARVLFRSTGRGIVNHAPQARGQAS